MERYTDRQLGRLAVRPGITGLAQVSGRASLPWPERIEIDLTYIERRSLLFDLRIILRTAVTVFVARGSTAARAAAGSSWRARLRRVQPVTDDSPFDALVVRCASAEEAQALPAGVGSELAYLPGDVDRGSTPAEELPEAEIGRLALAVADGAASWAPMLVVDCADWSVACTLTSGQLHRLANALGAAARAAAFGPSPPP